MVDIKQILVWRNDLKVRKGKLASQLAHASVSSLLKAYNYEKVVEKWFESGQTKIVLYLDNEEQLLDLKKKLEKNENIPHCLITDEGRTEFGGKLINTALGIGPWYSDEIDQFTKELKLL